jgi:hypothetical protein
MSLGLGEALWRFFMPPFGIAQVSLLLAPDTL